MVSKETPAITEGNKTCSFTFCALDPTASNTLVLFISNTGASTPSSCKLFQNTPRTSYQKITSSLAPTQYLAQKAVLNASKSEKLLSFATPQSAAGPRNALSAIPTCADSGTSASTNNLLNFFKNSIGCIVPLGLKNKLGPPKSLNNITLCLFSKTWFILTSFVTFFFLLRFFLLFLFLPVLGFCKFRIVPGK